MDARLAALGRRKLEPYRQNASNRQGEKDACNAHRPAKPIEHLAEHGAADEAAEEIAGEIDAARDAAVCRAPPGRQSRWPLACAKNVPTPTSTMPASTRQDAATAAAAGRCAATASAPQIAAACRTARPPAGQQRRDDRGQENEIDEAEVHHAERQRRAHQHEVDVGESADEGEQDAEADAEGGAQLRSCANAPASPRAVRPASAHRMHRAGRA